MSDTREICQFCKSSLKDKYALKSHLLKNKNCLKTRGLTLETKFVCKGCENVFPSKTNLNIHTNICKDYSLLKVREEYTEEIDKLRQEIVEKDKLINELQKYQINPDKVISDAQTQIQTLQKMLENIATKAVDKPTITTNTTNTITNQIRNCFSTKHFLEDIKIADVKRKCQSSLTEQILMDGQRGIARLCTDQIINTSDKKKLLIATDHTRAKFRYMDKEGNLKDDIEARTFIEKVSKPIKEVADIVFDNVLSCIKDEKEMLEDDDYSRKAELNDKELQANRSMMYIKCFDDPKHNSDFTNELAILNKT
jgi:hypothetical protein